MNGRAGNGEFCLPSTLTFPPSWSQETIEDLAETNCFPLDQILSVCTISLNFEIYFVASYGELFFVLFQAVI